MKTNWSLCPVLCVSYRKRTVATVVKGYGGWAGRATSVSTANCWSISAVTDSSLRPAKGLWWVFLHVPCSSLSHPMPTQSVSILANSELKLISGPHEWGGLNSLFRRVFRDKGTTVECLLVTVHCTCASESGSLLRRYNIENICMSPRSPEAQRRLTIKYDKEESFI